MNYIELTCKICGEKHALASKSNINGKCNKYEQDEEGTWWLTEDGVKVLNITEEY